MYQINPYTDADAGIGEVEGGVGVAAELEVKKVDDVAVEEAIDEVAYDAATKEAESELAGTVAEFKGVAPPKDRAERDEGEHGEPEALAGEHAPGCAGVADVDDVKETVDDHDGVGRTVGREREGGVDPELGGLVEGKDGDGEPPKESVAP